MTDRPPAAGGTTGPADTSGGYGPPPPWDPNRPPPPQPGGYPDQPGGYPDQGHPAAAQPGGYADRGRPAYPDQGQPGHPGAAQPGSYPDQAPPGGYPPAAYGFPYRAPRPRFWPPARREWTVALGVLAVFALLGALLAPLWEQLAPRLAFRVDQPGRALPVVPEAEEYVAADGRFVLLTLAAGILVGLACWLLRGSRGPLVLLALAVGGLLGAVVTWRLGLRLGPGYRPEDLQVVGRTVYQPLTLRARAGLVVEPIAAVVVYLLAVGFSAHNDLGRGDDPAPGPGVSSGSG